MKRLLVAVVCLGVALLSISPALAQTKSSGQKSQNSKQKGKSGKGGKSSGSKNAGKSAPKGGGAGPGSTKQSGTSQGNKPKTDTKVKGGVDTKASSSTVEDDGASGPDKAFNYGALTSVALYNGKDLTGWSLRRADGKNAWKPDGPMLTNTEPGTDLVSDRKFSDFELHLEVNVPKNGNSGVYLQGRYEIQIADSAGATDLTNGMMGAIYGKAAPRLNAAKPANEWQTLDVHFQQALRDESGAIIAKARVTIILNDEIIADNVEIDGVTGGALDAAEGTPGPLMLQGDHTAVQYRNILIKELPSRSLPPAVMDDEPGAKPPPPIDKG